MLPLALAGVILIGAGCTSHSRLKRAKPEATAALTNLPPPDFAQEFRREQVNARAHTLYATGKYKDIGGARKTAEREITPNFDDVAQQQWARQQAAAQRRRASQASFEKELAGMSRR